jgi:GNAT superfamily N-acetyltransferase
MNFKIRDAEHADIEVILLFIKELADHHNLIHKVEADEYSLHKSLFCEDPKAHVIIAEVDGDPVGLALYFYNFSTFLGKPTIHLEDLYLKEEHRSNGYGKQLLAYLAQKAIDQDCGRLEWMVSDRNKPTIEFYKSIGAEALHEWTVQRVTGDALEKLAKSNY